MIEGQRRGHQAEQQRAVALHDGVLGLGVVVDHQPEGDGEAGQEGEETAPGSRRDDLPHHARAAGDQQNIHRQHGEAAAGPNIAGQPEQRGGAVQHTRQYAHESGGEAQVLKQPPRGVDARAGALQGQGAQQGDDRHRHEEDL